MAELTIDQKRALAMASARLRIQQQPSSDGSNPDTTEPETVWRGGFLPVNKDSAGNMHFDPFGSGLIGGLRNGLSAASTSVKRVYTGELPIVGPDGHTSQQAIDEALNIATMFTPMNPAVRAGDLAIPGVTRSVRKAIPEAPTAERLKAAAGEGYEAVRNMGVDYKTTAVNDLSRQTQAQLYQDGISPSLAPKTYSILAELEQHPAGSVASIANLEAARRAFSNGAKDFTNPTEQLAAKRAIESLDGFLTRSDPATVAAGDASAVGPVLQDARGNYAAFKRSQRLTDAEERAKNNANAANSGANIGNNQRRQAASILNSDKNRAGFTAEDIAALKAINEGSMAANVTRRVGNMLGGGGGIGASLISLGGASTGAMTGSPGIAAAGAALPLVGAISKEISNSLTERAMQNLAKNTRKNSPLFKEMMKNAPNEGVTPLSAKLARSIMFGSMLPTTALDPKDGWL